jgi:hypothetical protein
MFLGRIITFLQAKHLSYVPVELMTKIFVGGDILSFIVQGAGKRFGYKSTQSTWSRVYMNVLTVSSRRWYHVSWVAKHLGDWPVDHCRWSLHSTSFLRSLCSFICAISLQNPQISNFTVRKNTLHPESDLAPRLERPFVRILRRQWTDSGSVHTPSH